MLRPVTEGDVPALVAMINRAYRGSHGGWNTEGQYLAGDRITAELLRADLAAKPDSAFLAWAPVPGAAAIGCVWLEPKGDGRWLLGTFAIDPAEQARGLGKALLSAAEDWVRARNGHTILMTVINVRTALIAWYGRRGYHPNGDTKAFPYADNRFGIPLRDDLDFVVLEKRLAGA